MSIENFYTFSSNLSRSTVQAHLARSANMNDKKNSSEEYELLKGEYSNITFPAVFIQKYGKNLEDILDTGWVSLYLISSNLKRVLEDHDLTGWKTFEIRLLNKKSEEIKGFYGFSVTGKCGAIDYNKSEIIQKQVVPTGPLTKFYKGLYIGLDKWGGEDFFLPDKYLGIIVTKRVYDIFKKYKLSNVNFQNLAEVQTDEYSVEVAVENMK